MKKQPHTALVTSVPFNRAALARLPGLLRDLGPVKAASVRIASRAANALRAGYAARSWDDLRPCRLLLVSASGEKLDALVAEMNSSLDHWKRRSVALIASGADSRALAPLVRRGASVAAVHLLGDPVDPLIFLEGDAPALREMRRRVTDKAIVIRKGTSALPAVAAAELRLLLPPMLDAAIGALRHAGLNPVQSWRVLDAFVALSLRAFRKSGARSWRDASMRHARTEFFDQLEVLRAIQPGPAQFLSDAAAAAFRRFVRDAKVLHAHQ